MISDYESLPEHGWSQPWSRQAVLVLTVVGALLAGFLLATALRAGRTAALEQDVRRSELIELIAARQEHAVRLAGQLETLRARVTTEEERVAGGVPLMQLRMQQLEIAAGLTPVRGPGLRVQLADAGDPCPTGRTEDCRIQDADIQLTVNALFAAGAEAVAVNGERVIGTTAIRSAGHSILVNYRVLASPYIVEAVGDSKRLETSFTESDVARDFGVWKDVYGLGYSVQQVDEVLLPAYGGRLRMRNARAVEEAAQ